MAKKPEPKGKGLSAKDLKLIEKFRRRVARHRDKVPLSDATVRAFSRRVRGPTS